MQTSREDTDSLRGTVHPHHSVLESDIMIGGCSCCCCCCCCGCGCGCGCDPLRFNSSTLYTKGGNKGSAKGSENALRVDLTVSAHFVYTCRQPCKHVHSRNYLPMRCDDANNNNSFITPTGCDSAAVKAKKGACYYRCYDKTVGGDPYKHIEPMSQKVLTSAWEAAFNTEDVKSGGCPKEPLVYGKVDSV